MANKNYISDGTKSQISNYKCGESYELNIYHT